MAVRLLFSVNGEPAAAQLERQLPIVDDHVRDVPDEARRQAQLVLRDVCKQNLPSVERSLAQRENTTIRTKTCISWRGGMERMTVPFAFVVRAAHSKNVAPNGTSENTANAADTPPSELL